VIFVLVLICRVDEYIAKVTHGEVVTIRLWTIINVHLKCCPCICQPEVNNMVFVQALAGSECPVDLAVFFDWDGVVGLTEIQFSEGLGLAHSLEWFRD